MALFHHNAPFRELPCGLLKMLILTVDVVHDFERSIERVPFAIRGSGKSEICGFKRVYL